MMTQDAGRRKGTRRSALWGWSPPDLPAGSGWQRRIDRLLPRTRVLIAGIAFETAWRLARGSNALRYGQRDGDLCSGARRVGRRARLP
jgi:hypothetical protein